ncbi:MAG: carbamoyltransferase HypF [Candidatus Bathyarchaeota archaeon]|nr:carbamoyltransferase HypF [Candidatus Termiticorpusculum sp.]
MRVKLKVIGIVQGVGFRPFVYRIAVKNGLTGYVRNTADAGVEIVLEGVPLGFEGFMHDLSAEKPPLAQIDQVIKTTLTGEGEYGEFTISESLQTGEFSGSIVSPDISICERCLKELQNVANFRHDYFFITCTDCGPRFTIFERRPYDRENTTMREFSMCSFCQKQYADSSNRRFHAQTVACQNCGPQVYLTTSMGELVKTLDPVREAGKLLSKGKVLAVKGYGGFHIACSATLEGPLLRLREVKHRHEKPFAVMARSLEVAKHLAEVNSKEQELLTSPMRPIVLLNKGACYNLSPLVAPNLHNVGIMLPYTGLHYMLFDQVSDNAFVMTSANPSNQPIINDNLEALRTLSDTVDYFLFHNRRIAHRCDDSVMRVNGDRQVFLRRSRGYVPSPIRMKRKSLHCAVGFGSELNNTSCILLEDKAFISQHIGDVENVETRTFLAEATEHLLRLINGKVEVLACDLHPKFNTTSLANEWVKARGLQLVRVQHHHAHAAALMGEHSLDEIIGIVCDGYGYGVNGEAWGGEILMCQADSTEFRRLGHLEPQPLLGGDLASKYPTRIAAGILQKADVNIEKYLMQNSNHLPHGEVEAELILGQLRNGVDAIQTTSCGRVLDAVSTVLGICYQRSYEGEAAMKLETAALRGTDTLKLEPVLQGDVLETTNLLREIYENRVKMSVADLAYSAHAYLARGLAELSLEKAQVQGVKTVGFSGGVACNQSLTALMQKIVEEAGLEFVVHEIVPTGDGGVSFGQTVVAGSSSF